MLVNTLRGGFGNLMNIRFFFTEFLISSLTTYSRSAIKWRNLKENIAKSTLLEIPKLPSTERALSYLLNYAVKFFEPLKL